MKKILSVILTAAMLLSLLIVVAVPASAVDGMWVTYADPSTYEAYESGEREEPPMELGYEYTEEGFKTIACDWTENMPRATVQSRDPVNFEDGIYMLFSLDEYAYEGNDAWVNVSFWDRQNIAPGSNKYGSGVQTLIRPAQDAEGKWGFNAVNWWAYEWVNAGYSNMVDENGEKVMHYPDENGRVFFEVILSRDSDGLYHLTINGAEATTPALNCFIEKFPDGEAYVGITMHNTTLHSSVGLTIHKFGTSKATATTPAGDDRKEPVNNTYEAPAEIADPSTVPEGQPAIFMTGDKENSHCSGFSAGQGDTATANDDLTVHVVDTNNDRWNSTKFSVKKEVSYDIDDFPVMMFLTKNYCTCEDPTDCYATESCAIYVMAGDMRAPASGGCRKTPEIDICWEPIVIEEGDKAGQYLYFWYDTHSEMAQELTDWSGRIHATQMEFSSLSTDATRRTIDIEWVAFFRTVEDGEAFVMSYLGLDAEEETTEEITEATTEAVVVTTEAPEAVTTEAPTEEKTEEKTEAKTEAKPEEKTEDKGNDGGNAGDKGDKGDKTGGCGGVIGAGAFAVIALVTSCGAALLKKKD